MDEREFDFINMIPFIDIMLVLLAIILTTSTFVAAGAIRVDLPKVAGKHESATKVYVVEIACTGDIFYQGAAVDVAGLGRAIGTLPRDTAFLIKADRNLKLQSFVEVLDLVKTAGFTRVSVQTQWKGRR
ncbi:MAG: biopolymer transporter ExbD [Syntrophaceae bacterium]